MNQLQRNKMAYSESLKRKNDVINHYEQLTTEYRQTIKHQDKIIQLQRKEINRLKNQSL